MTLGTVVIGGGSGFIGRAIARNLSKIGYDVLTVSRQPKLNSISWNDVTKEGLPKSCVAVINVAGQNILDAKRRWTPGFQQNVYASRIHTTKLLAEEIQKMDVPPKVFGVISGVGFYPPSKTETYTEESPGCSEDYFSQLCSDWEAASVLPPHLNVRRFVVRSGRDDEATTSTSTGSRGPRGKNAQNYRDYRARKRAEQKKEWLNRTNDPSTTADSSTINVAGVVLGRTGGIIQQMFWPFYFGVGGTIGSGKQYFPWIHIDDIAGIFTHGVQSVTVHGILNGVSPEIVTNKEFTKAFSRALWRPAVLPIPEFAINLAFGGERARMMMEGQKVVPQRTLESGYKFLYPDIKSAVKECAHIIMDLNKR